MVSKLVLSAAVLMAATSSLGAEEEKQTKFDKVMAKYERTGETKRCVNPSRLNESRVLDEGHILFRVSPKTAYLNTLPRQCRSLKFYQAIAYTVRGSQICANDFFRVIDRMMVPGASCSFGEFEKVVKKTAKANTGGGAAASEE